MADQLQTNFASDLRNILKCVFLMNSSQTPDEIEPMRTDDVTATQPDAVPAETEERTSPEQDTQNEHNEIDETTPTNERSTTRARIQIK